MGATTFGQNPIRFEGSRVAIKVFSWPELEWINEHTHEHRPLCRSETDQLTMTLVQPPHGGHKLQRSTEVGPEAFQLGLGGENDAAQRNTSSLTWAIPEAVSPRSEAAPWSRSITR